LKKNNYLHLSREKKKPPEGKGSKGERCVGQKEGWRAAEKKKRKKKKKKKKKLSDAKGGLSDCFGTHSESQ